MCTTVISDLASEEANKSNRGYYRGGVKAEVYVCFFVIFNHISTSSLRFFNYFSSSF